jgi:CBS domain-containing protein
MGRAYESGESIRRCGKKDSRRVLHVTGVGQFGISPLRPGTRGDNLAGHSLMAHEESGPMQVREIMSREVGVVDSESTLLDAAVKMKLYDVGMLVVTEQGAPVGVVTDRDIVVRGVAEGADPTLTQVKRLMSTSLVTCFDSDEIEDASVRMRDHQVRRLLVLNTAGETVGVVTLGDIARRTRDVVMAGSVSQEVMARSTIEDTRPRADD